MSISINNLTNIQKIAIFLLSLGSDLSAQILKQGFMEDEIERISMEIANLYQVPRSVQDAVIDEYLELKQAREYLLQGGVAYARELLQKTVGPVRAEEIIKKLLEAAKNLPFSSLRKTDPKHLLSFIRDEHPQTIALVLSYLDSNQASEILSALPDKMQADIAKRVATMERAAPEMVQEVEQVLKNKLLTVSKDERTEVGGLNSLVKILNSVDRSTEKTILDTLDVDDPLLAEEIRKRLFVFEDIIKLDGVAIQKVLREVDMRDLALAIRGAGEDVRNCIYKNQSRRASEMLKDEIETMGPVRLKDVEDAQQKIVKVIRRLEESGEIVISRGGEDVLVL